MKLKLTLEMRPMTRPGRLTTEEVECDSMTRNEQTFPGGPIWAVFHGAKTKNHQAKSEYRILESVIKKIEEEEF